MKNKFKSLFAPDQDDTVFFKSPTIVGIVLIYLATVFVPNSDKLSLNEIVGFTIVIIIQMIICLLSNKLFKKRYWLYFVIQGIITFDYVVVSPDLYKTIFLGLIPLFVIQSMIVYSDAVKVVITAMLFYGIFCIAIIIISGVNELIKSIPVLIIITISMRAYSMIFF